MRFHRASVRTVPALVAGVLALWSLNTAHAQPLTLRYAQAYSAAHSIFSLPITVAQREGLFRREGLNVSIVIPVPGGSDKMIAALHDDWADVTHVATPFLIRAALAGSDAVAIDTEFKNPIYSLIAKPEITSYAGLKGKLIGLADEAGTITISMRKLLAMHGLNTGDFAAKIQEGTPGRYNCLRGGDCDAVVLGQPQDLQAIAEGYRLIGRSTEAVPDFLYTVTAARRSWAQTHKDALVRFVRGMAASFAFIRAPDNRDRVVKLVAETLGCSDAIAAQTLDLFLKPGSDVLPARGEIDLAALQQVVAMLGDAGLLKPPLPQAARFADLDYLRAAGLQ
jgi:ABC-type nitrate/sulfonate/bicarbonate transport system substrate-binding protein